MTLLACELASLPRRDLDLARRLGLALEVPLRGEGVPEPADLAGLPVAAVHAWELHRVHPMHVDAQARAAAHRHVEAALALAAGLGAPRVLVVAGYGHRLADRPVERARDFLAAVAHRGRDLGVRILLEHLGPSRLGVLTTPAEVADLAEDLDLDLLLDTGHLADAGHDPGATLATWSRPLTEVHLKGPGSTIAAPEAVEDWILGLARPPEVLCLEHREPATEGMLAAAVEAARRALAGLSARR